MKCHGVLSYVWQFRPGLVHSGIHVNFEPGQHPNVCAALKLRLYIAQHTFESTAALAQVQSFLQKYGSTYSLEVLDVQLNRELSLQDQIPLTPMLLRLEPGPILRIALPAQHLVELETALLGNFGPLIAPAEPRINAA